MDTIEILGIEEILNQPDPDWLIEGWLQEDSFAVLAGPSNTFKSFLAVDWACSIASKGIDWQWQPVKRHGPVLYIYAEGGAGMKKRLQAWKVKYKQGLENFHGIGAVVNLSSETSVAALVRKIRAKGLDPVLIIIDTLNRCFGDGDENSTKDMGAFIRGCDKLRTSFTCCTVLAVHHTGWATEHERGNSSLRGALDTLLKITKREKNKIGVKVEKQKNFEEDDKPTWLELLPVKGSNSAALSLAEPPTKSKGNQNDQKVLAALAAAHPAGLRPVELEHKTDINHNTMKNVIERLVRDGKAEKKDAKLFAIPQDE
jgi:hypothetical protein